MKESLTDKSFFRKKCCILFGYSIQTVEKRQFQNEKKDGIVVFSSQNEKNSKKNKTSSTSIKLVFSGSWQYK
ncbi:hypothetical protein MFLO_14632 [Listeria floridensis FSL S10-1187]|uniref:Uncharacterized protein n=1 Tax=Listeria floridensis FSL S10-1187 TaxID=1265817 RepID=A0ABP3AU70_9LIST|nr:hypothetical protein MFLO_14632 [Listeria floridensis FSL S10-1187]